MAYDKRHDVEQGWVAVVLRNLPPTSTTENVAKNFSFQGTNTAATEYYRILRAQHPINIKGQRCSLVQVENIEQAENFSKKW